MANCEGCGREWPKPFFAVGTHRVTHCPHCPPKAISAESPPDLHTQLEDLLNVVRDCERRDRLQDRIDLMRD